MAYTKTLIGDITEKGVYNPSTVITQGVATICDTNFTAIETQLTNIAVEATADAVGAMVTGNTETGISVTYQDADNTLDFAVAYGTEPGAVSSSSSGQAGSADTASRSDHNHDLGAHAHSGVTDGGSLTGYQAVFSANTTLTQLGIVPPVAPAAWTGTAMSALTGASTFQQLLNAIDTDIATAATLPSAG